MEELKAMGSEEGVGDLSRDDGGAQRYVTAGDALGHRQYVRLKIPVLAGEHLAGASKAIENLVGDQQDAVPITDLSHGGPVVRRRHPHAERNGDRLGDQCGHGLGTLGNDRRLEGLRGAQADFGCLPAVLFGSVWIWARNVDAVRNQWLKGLAVRRQPADAECAERESVVGPDSADDLRALGRPAQSVVLAGHLEGRLHGLGATR